MKNFAAIFSGADINTFILMIVLGAIGLLYREIRAAEKRSNARTDEQIASVKELLEEKIKAVEARFDEQIASVKELLEEKSKAVEARFDATNTRIDEQIASVKELLEEKSKTVDARFDAVDNRLEALATWHKAADTRFVNQEQRQAQTNETVAELGKSVARLEGSVTEMRRSVDGIRQAGAQGSQGQQAGDGAGQRVAETRETYTSREASGVSEPPAASEQDGPSEPPQAE